MNDPSPHPDATGDPAKLDEQLVAYLDGELDENTAREVETLVAGDPRLRDRLAELGGTWELLDHLDRSETEATFTESTLELVVAQAEDESHRSETERPRLRRRRRVITAVGLLLAAIAGFAVVALMRYDANRRFLRDLPLVENVGQYSQIFGSDDTLDQSVDFLKKLRAAKLFVEEDQDADSAAVDAAGEDLDQRRERIEQMAPDQQDELAQAWEQFANLDGQRQEQIRRFHERLDAEADPEALRDVMRRYCAWLDTLSGFSQDELKKMPVDERVKKIGAERYWAQDARVLHRWFGDICKRSIDALRRQEKGKAVRRPDWNPRWMGMRLASENKVDVGASILKKMASKEDLARLREQLSPASELKNIEGEDKQYRWVVKELIKCSRRDLQQRLVEGLGKPRREVSDKELAEFLQSSDSLTDDMKEWLLSLPGKEMYEKLRFLYLSQYLSQERSPGARMPGHQRPPRQGPPFWPRGESPGGQDRNRPSGSRQGPHPMRPPPEAPGADFGPPPAEPEAPPRDRSSAGKRTDSRGAPEP